MDTSQRWIGVVEQMEGYEIVVRLSRGIWGLLLASGATARSRWLRPTACINAINMISYQYQQGGV
ncbi:MAG: hypothetical protein AMS18_01650 [Gemmatimonas sp. SG8_17]|nr:MAG: hypothetical protein AMS18_01650 [Gemmatimonas sp. SG8_17]